MSNQQVIGHKHVGELISSKLKERERKLAQDQNQRGKSPGKDLEMQLDGSVASLSSSKQEMNESNVMNVDDITKGHLFGAELCISDVKGMFDTASYPEPKTKNKLKDSKDLNDYPIDFDIDKMSSNNVSKNNAVIVPKNSIQKLNHIKQDMKNQIQKLEGKQTSSTTETSNVLAARFFAAKQERPKSTPNKYSFKQQNGDKFINRFLEFKKYRERSNDKDSIMINDINTLTIDTEKGPSSSSRVSTRQNNHKMHNFNSPQGKFDSNPNKFLARQNAKEKGPTLDAETFPSVQEFVADSTFTRLRQAQLQGGQQQQRMDAFMKEWHKMKADKPQQDEFISMNWSEFRQLLDNPNSKTSWSSFRQEFKKKEERAHSTEENRSSSFERRLNNRITVQGLDTSLKMSKNQNLILSEDKLNGFSYVRHNRALLKNLKFGTLKTTREDYKKSGIKCKDQTWYRSIRNTPRNLINQQLVNVKLNNVKDQFEKQGDLSQELWLGHSDNLTKTHCEHFTHKTTAGYSQCETCGMAMK